MTAASRLPLPETDSPAGIVVSDAWFGGFDGWGIFTLAFGLFGAVFFILRIVSEIQDSRTLRIPETNTKS